MHNALDYQLETVQVLDPDQWENDIGPKGWYAVVNEDGIIAYFGNERDALGFRLYEVNRRLNGEALEGGP